MTRFSRQFVEQNIRQYGQWFGDEYLPEGMTQVECRRLAEQIHGAAAGVECSTARSVIEARTLSQSAGAETLDRLSQSTLERLQRLGLDTGDVGHPEPQPLAMQRSAQPQAMSQSAENAGGAVPSEGEIKDAANRLAVALNDQRRFETLLRTKSPADPNYHQYRTAAEDATRVKSAAERELDGMVARAPKL